MRYWLVTSDLPDPEPQVALVDRCRPGGAHGDLGYSGWKVLLEYEGRQHAERDQFRRDVDRYSLTALDGWLVLRFADHHLGGPVHRRGTHPPGAAQPRLATGPGLIMGVLPATRRSGGMSPGKTPMINGKGAATSWGRWARARRRQRRLLRLASMPASVRWASVIGVGAPVSGSKPAPVFGKAMTSRIDSTPVSSADEPVPAERGAGVRRRPVGEGLEEEPEPLPGLLARHAEGLEHPLLQARRRGYAPSRSSPRCR